MNRRKLLAWFPLLGCYLSAIAGSKTIPVIVHIDRELLERAKIAAASRNETLEQGIIEAIRDWSSGYEAKKRKKNVR